MGDQIKGWKFPVSFNVYSKSVETVNSDETSIRESLIVLLSTTIGERNMVDNYGCNVMDMAFQKIDTNMITFMTNNIRMAIDKWEKRIIVNNVFLKYHQENQEYLSIKIDYTIKNNSQNEILDFNFNF